MKLLPEKYSDKISGILHCYDRIVITGTLPVLSNAHHLTAYMNQRNIRIFDYVKFAEPYRDLIKENAQFLADKAGVAIEFINKGNVRKEALIEKKLKQRGHQPGLVHIISVMEGCNSYKPWHNKITHQTFLKYDQGKCLTYYFYFIDELLGLCYVRVPTWLPFKLQIYFNCHGWLSNMLARKNIAHKVIDNAFVQIDDWQKAQLISDTLSIKQLHKKLDAFGALYCPVHKEFKQQYHWSLMQCEYSTDIVFNKQEELKEIYTELIACAIHTVKPENIVTFLGKKLHPLYEGEIGNQYHVRLEGSRIKHSMGSQAAIKMYDKFAHILRIETTVNDVSFFKHYREVIHRNGTSSQKEASMKKNIYSLNPLREIVAASNLRYLEFISAIDDHTIGHKKLQKVTESKTSENRNYKGFNFFSKADKQLLLTLSRGEFNIYGFRCKHLCKYLDYTKSQLSRLLKRLRIHGLIKKAGKSYKYYLTQFGKEVINCGQKVIDMIIIPQLSKSI
jgi:DNA-binding MarR family transcriptional regulator